MELQAAPGHSPDRSPSWQLTHHKWGTGKQFFPKLAWVLKPLQVYLAYGLECYGTKWLLVKKVERFILFFFFLRKKICVPVSVLCSNGEASWRSHLCITGPSWAEASWTSHILPFQTANTRFLSYLKSMHSKWIPCVATLDACCIEEFKP